MEQEKLHRIIRDKNEERERSVLRSAEDIIESIVKEQHSIAASTKKIDDLRKELAALQVQELDPKAILGGE